MTLAVNLSGSTIVALLFGVGPAQADDSKPILHLSIYHTLETGEERAKVRHTASNRRDGLGVVSDCLPDEGCDLVAVHAVLAPIGLPLCLVAFGHHTEVLVRDASRFYQFGVTVQY